MVHGRYIAILAVGILLWVSLLLTFSWIVDPYGISPFRISSKNFNKFKPKRIDIDRLIKPYEVWRHQPRSVFLGTSRIHQSIDPALLAGTQYAPAYNASIPGSFLSVNAAYLEQYFQLNKNQKFVFVELFFWNFIVGGQQIPKLGLSQFLENSAGLNLSGEALLASIQTIQFNLFQRKQPPYIHEQGYWVRPPDVGSNLNADSYITAIMSAHKNIPDMILQPTAFEALDKIVEDSKKNGATLYLLITPNYPYDDYRLFSLGYWSLLEGWYRRLAQYPNVISFSQYHAPLQEPDSASIKYWYDTIHFSKDMGRLMIKSFLGETGPDMPENMLVKINSNNVEEAIDLRRKDMEEWAAKNHAFAFAFDQAKFATGNDASQRMLRKP
jgi:hypothetical protein